MIETQFGDIVLLNRKKGGLFSSMQRFFTNRALTHCAICCEAWGIPLVLSADELVNTQPIENYLSEKDTDIYIYRLKNNTNPDLIKSVIIELYKENAGKYYDFTQLLWFPYEWLMRNFFNENVDKEHNPFSSGKNRQICSELVYRFLYLTTGSENIRFKYNMDQYTANTVNVADIESIILSSSIFELIHTNKA